MKSYTDLEQSEKLAEILSIETADGTWVRIAIAGESLDVPEELQYRHSEMPFKLYSGIGIPSWSLAALLGAVDFITINLFYIDERGYWVVSATIHNSTKLCTKYESAMAFNPVDACYELIIKLHEQNLL